MDSKISLRMTDEEKDEERHPLKHGLDGPRWKTFQDRKYPGAPCTPWAPPPPEYLPFAPTCSRAMVTENLKSIIIRKIYKDVERNVSAQKKNGSEVLHQYLAALGPVIAALSSGMSAGYSAILLPQLMAADSEITITKNEGSWIASMLALPLIFGCLMSGYFMDKFGRKTSQILSCIPFSLGWIVLAFSPNVAALYAGRFVTGFCMGLISPMCQVYIAETSQPRNRGILLSGAPLSVAIGIFISHILGTFLTWKVTAGICGIPPLVCIVLLLFAPESPSWLLQKNRIEAAEKSFVHFRGDSEEAVKEFNALLIKHRNPDEGDQTADVPKWKLSLNPSFLKPFLVLNFFFLVQQFSGVNAVAFYSINILKDVLSSMNEYTSTMVIDVVRFVVSVVAVLLLKRFGRKTLSVVSAIGTAVSLFCLAAYLGLNHLDSLPEGNSTLALVNETSFSETNGTSLLAEDLPEAPEDLLSLVVSYLPLVFLISYICFVSIGLVPIPWVLTGELFSKEMRGLGSGGTSSFGFLCYFAVVKLTPDFFDVLDTWGTFCLFGAVSVIGSVVLFLYLPETKDKTLMEIEAFYHRKKPGNKGDSNGHISNPLQQNGRESIQK